jgi:hypothetical protein
VAGLRTSEQPPRRADTTSGSRGGSADHAVGDHAPLVFSKIGLFMLLRGSASCGNRPVRRAIFPSKSRHFRIARIVSFAKTRSARCEPRRCDQWGKMRTPIVMACRSTRSGDTGTGARFRSISGCAPREADDRPCHAARRSYRWCSPPTSANSTTGPSVVCWVRRDVGASLSSNR